MLVVVVGAAHIAVQREIGLQMAVAFHRLLAQPLLEDGGNALVVDRAGRQCTLTGALQPALAVISPEAQQAQAGAVPRFEMAPALQLLLHHL